MLDLAALRALQMVSACGSISSAASAMHLTTSAVSQRLTKLERQLAQPLLERYGRGVRLTDAARLLVSRADRILSLVDEAAAELEGHRGAVVGRVSVAGFPSAARGLLTVALSALAVEYPHLTLHMSEMEPDVSVPMVLRGDIDVAVVQDWFNVPLSLPAGVCKAELLDDVADIAVPSAHPLAGRDTVDLGELAGERWVSWPAGSGCHDWLRFTLRGYGVEPTIAHTAEEYATQLAMVAAGFGVAVIPRLGRNAPPEGVRVLGVQPQLSRHVYAVWREENGRRPALTAAVRALVDAANGTD